MKNWNILKVRALKRRKRRAPMPPHRFAQLETLLAPD